MTSSCARLMAFHCFEESASIVRKTKVAITDAQQNHRPQYSKTSEATVVLQTPSLRGWGVEKMFVTNSLTGEVWVNLVGSNDLKGEEWVNLS